MTFLACTVSPYPAYNQSNMEERTCLVESIYLWLLIKTIKPSIGQKGIIIDRKSGQKNRKYNTRTKQ